MKIEAILFCPKCGWTYEMCGIKPECPECKTHLNILKGTRNEINKRVKEVKKDLNL